MLTKATSPTEDHTNKMTNDIVTVTESTASAGKDSSNVLLMTLVEAASNAFDEQQKEQDVAEEMELATAPTTESTTTSDVSTEQTRRETSTPSSMHPLALTMISPSPPTLPKPPSSASLGSLNSSSTTASSSTSNNATFPAPSAASSSKSIYTMSSSSSLFLSRLRRTLDNEHTTSLQWMPDGKSFQIVQSKDFIKQVLPTIFQLKNRSSFLRKLNGMGFQRIHDKITMNLDIFQHPQFLRDVPPQVGYASTIVVGRRPPTTSMPTVQTTTKAASSGLIARSVSADQDKDEGPTVVVPTKTTVPPSLPRLVHPHKKRHRHMNAVAAAAASRAGASTKVALPPRVQQYAPAVHHSRHMAAVPHGPPPIHHVDYGRRHHHHHSHRAHPHVAKPPSSSSQADHDRLLIQSLLHERESLLQGMDRMSYALNNLLSSSSSSQQQPQHGPSPVLTLSRRP